MFPKSVDAQISSVTQQLYTSTAEMNRLILMDSLAANMTDTSEGGIYQAQQRFINFRKTRLVSFDSVASPEPGLVWNTTTTYNCTKIDIFNNCDHYAPNLSNTIASNWRSAGHEGDNLQAEGKVDCIWVDPTTTSDAIAANDIIIIGTACSGLWKTTNSGKNWICITESLQLTSLGVVKIVVNKNNINEIWIGTGGFWNFSYGMFHTIDGGVTWCKQNLPAPLEWPYQNELPITALVVHPTNPLQLVASNTKFLYTTLDGGNTWVPKARVPWRITPLPSPIIPTIPLPAGLTILENWFNFTAKFNDIALDVSNNNNNKIYVSVSTDGTLVEHQNSQHMFVSYEDIWNTTYTINPVSWNDPNVNNSTPNPLPFVDLTSNILLNNPLLLQTANNPLVPPSPQPYLFMQPRFAAVCDANGDVYVSAGLGDNDQNNVIPANRLFNKKYTKITNTWEDLPQDLIPMFNEGGPNWHRNNIILDPTITGIGTNTVSVTNHVYIGGTCVSEIFKTTTGWTPLTHISSTDFITQHADINAMTIRNGKIYACTDGGLMVSSTQGPAVWASLNGDLKIGIANGMSASPYSGNIVSALMDNGFKVKRGDQWQLGLSGDGYGAEYEVNGNMKNKFHFMGNYGANYLVNDNNSGFTTTSIFGATPARLHQAIEDDVNNPATGTYFAGVAIKGQVSFRQFFTNDIRKTSAINRLIINTTPRIIPPFWSMGLGDKTVTTFTADNRNSKNVLFGVFDRNGGDHHQLYKTNAAGNINFSPISTDGSTIFNDWINTIATDPSTSGSTQRIWVGTGHLKAIFDENTGGINHLANHRNVFYSADGGTTFKDVSYGLTNYPINKLLFNEARNLLFAATDYGVYVMNINGSPSLWSWQCFNTQLPYTIVTDIEINECTGKLIASTLGRGIWETSLPPISGNTDDITIANNTNIIPTGITTYNATSIISKTIIVPNGAQLIIEGTPANPITLNFLPRKGIQVRKGGSLIVRNAILTNECGNLWAGITVDGDITQVSQPTIANVPNPTNAQAAGGTNFGIAWLYNATISNAYTGMANSRFKYYPGQFDPVADGNSGGIIIAHNSKFINNRLAVGITQFGAADESRFVDNEFIANAYLQGYTGNNPVTQFVFAWDVKDVVFLRNRFVNIQSSTYTASVSDWPMAIYGYDAGLKITNNYFENMAYSVYLDFIPIGWNTPLIKDNELNKTWRGIYLSGCTQHLNVYNNTINLILNPEFVDPCLHNFKNNAVGIYIDNCAAEQIKENKISYVPDYNKNPEDKSYGIIMQNISEIDKESYTDLNRNFFTNIYFGITFLEANWDVRFRCNYFENPIAPSENNKFVNIQAILPIDQNCQSVGLTNLNLVHPLAGNRFSNCTNNQVDRFATDITVPPFKYLEYNETSHRAELCMSSLPSIVDAQIYGLNYLCKDFVCCPLEPFEDWPKIGQTPSDDFVAMKILDSVIEQKENLIDNDKTILLLNMLDNATISNVDVIQEINSIGGLLSDAVLYKIINKTINPFSNYVLKNIMIANSPLSDNIYASLQTIRPVVAYNYTVWNEQNNGISTRNELEADIQNLKSDKNERLQNMIESYLDNNKKDSAITMLLLNNKLYQAIPMLVSNKDYSLAQTCINQLPNPQLKFMYNLHLSLVMQNKTIRQINSTDSIIIDSLAKGQGLASVFATNMIHFLYHKMPQKRIGKFSTSSAQRKMKPNIDYSEILPEKDIYFYPNPASEFITIVNNSNVAISNIAIYNSVGTLITQQNYKTFAQQLQFDILNISAGTYNLVITNSKNQIILNEKVLINHH